MSEPIAETPIKHVINVACTEEPHASRPVRVCAFGDWIGPWGGDPEQEDADQPWHHLRHWISEDAPLRPMNANVSAEPIVVLRGDDRQGDPSRAGRTNHPSWKEMKLLMDKAAPQQRPDYSGLSEQELEDALAAALSRLGRGRRPDADSIHGDMPAARVTYDLRCPLCDLHLSVRAERLYLVLSVLAPHGKPVPGWILDGMEPANGSPVWKDLGVDRPPEGPISSFTLSLSALAARVGNR